MNMRRVAKHFRLECFGVMGHSRGGGMACHFAVLHPDKVDALVMLDILKPVSRNLDTLREVDRAAVDTFLALDEKAVKDGESPMVSSYDESKKRLLKGWVNISMTLTRYCMIYRYIFSTLDGHIGVNA